MGQGVVQKAQVLGYLCSSSDKSRPQLDVPHLRRSVSFFYPFSQARLSTFSKQSTNPIVSPQVGPSIF